MNNYSSIIIISTDVFLVIKSMNSVGWNAIRESSINRILYISSVVYLFRFPNKKNIFEENYRFDITLSGPEDATIQQALVNLCSNDFIEQSEEGFYVTDRSQITGFENIPLYDEKKDWIEDMAYIIGVYGEDKIYDFIFRDPEYRTSLKTNSEFGLDIGQNNETIKFLNQFKGEFEKNIDKNILSLDNRKYLELYFEYVFGNILRGE